MKNSKKTKILIPTLRGITRVSLKKIVFCEADNFYSKVFLSNKEELNTTITLKALEDLINCDSFLRCHRSYVINLHFFSEFLKPNNIILLETDRVIKLSKAKKKEFLEMLSAYIKCPFT